MRKCTPNANLNKPLSQVTGYFRESGLRTGTTLRKGRKSRGIPQPGNVLDEFYTILGGPTCKFYQSIGLILTTNPKEMNKKMAS